MTLPYQHFKHCPRCGHTLPAPLATPVVNCNACNLTLFLSPAVGLGAFLSSSAGKILFLVRTKEPGKGKLGLPGGFADYHEAAEAGLTREIKEEIGITISDLTYLCSRVNYYDYANVNYPVLDLFFTGHIPNDAQPQCLDDVDELAWLHPSQVQLESIAFPSVRNAFEFLISRQQA